MASNLFFYGLIILILFQLFRYGYTAPESIEDEKSCLANCQLTLISQYSAHKRFMNKSRDTAVILIYFNISVDKKPLYNSSNDDFDDLYAWSKGVVGEPIFSLPQYYMSACLFLPYVFHESLNLEVSESEPNCIFQATDQCRQYIIYRTLIDFTKIDNCDGDKCDTICHRKFTDQAKPEFYDVQYSCCEPPAFHDDLIDPDSCIKPIHIKQFPAIHRAILALSSFTAAVLVFYLASSCILWQGRYVLALPYRTLI